MAVLPPRPRAIARVPLGRGRARRLLRPQAATVFRAGALEREGPDPEGAAVRPEQRRGQPRRGRQGVLLLSRFDADPLVHEVALQVPAGGVSLRRPGEDECAAARRQDYEYELIDTGVFDDDRYFDVVVEYAKSSPEECFIRITVANRGPEAATIHLLPTLWFRNTWTWWPERGEAAPGGGDRHRRRERRGGVAPGARRAMALLRWRAAAAVHRERHQHRAALRHAEREPVRQGRLPRVRRPRERRCRQPGAGRHQGRRPLPPRGRRRPVGDRSGSASPMRRRRSARSRRSTRRSTARRREADEFYRRTRRRPRARTPRSVMRQAFGGLFWTKQYYFFDVNMWLREHGVHPFDSPASVPVRNRHWFHMFNDDVISMPDKWEYPWYAAWDLAFHAVALARRRSGLRQASAQPDVEGALSAFQRPAARLRVELRRRQPAGACVGDALPVPHGAGDARRGRRRVPEARLRQAR